MPSIPDINTPLVIAAEKDFLVVYKPPLMHSAPQKNSTGKNILEWCVQEYPEIMDLPGRRAGEGGLIHRLDYETQGLLLLARSRSGMETLFSQQVEGKFQKEYNALAAESKLLLPGFPDVKPGNSTVNEIKSAFRPYGPGRKTVRPVCVETSSTERQKEQYITEIPESYPVSDSGVFSFRLRIVRGFRHQIRSHLAWLGMPILNDRLYGGCAHGKGLLALRAFLIAFNDPSSGKKLRYEIPCLDLEEI